MSSMIILSDFYLCRSWGRVEGFASKMYESSYDPEPVLVSGTGFGQKVCWPEWLG